MKHNATFLITAFSLLCANAVIHGMEKEDKPNIYCEEDIAIVLHLEDYWYSWSYQDPDDCSYNKENPTEIAYNNINKNTKVSDVSFDDYMKNVEKTFTEAANKKNLIKISAYLIASHSKHTSCDENNITPSTLDYFGHAQHKIYAFCEEYRKKTGMNENDIYINIYKIFYKPSYFNNEQREQNDIKIITDNNETKIKIVDKAMIDLQRHHLDLTMPNDITIKETIGYLHRTQTKKADKLLLDIQPDTQSIFLMDV